MPRAPASLVHAAAATPTSTPTEQQPVASVDSDMVVILASFLCALICVLGLALVSRCACRFCRGQASSPPPKAAEGLKKKAIDALPTVSYSSGTAANNPSDCAICLADFADGDALRVLPRCGHAFHVACVDAWLRTRATCPSCRAAAAIKGAAGAPAQHQQPAPPGAAACGRCGSQVQVLVPTSSSTPGYDTFLP